MSKKKPTNASSSGELKDLQLPRAPMPRQTGGPFKIKKNRPWRHRKHKGQQAED